MWFTKSIATVCKDFYELVSTIDIFLHELSFYGWSLYSLRNFNEKPLYVYYALQYVGYIF